MGNMEMYLLLLVMCLNLNAVQPKKQIKVGGIFHEWNYDSQVAFMYAIDRANMYNHKLSIIPVIHTIPSDESFRAEKIVCNLTAEGVAAIFGPSSLQTRSIVSSICQVMEIPHMLVTWLPDLPYPADRPSMTINFYPDQHVLSNALAALVEDYDWQSYTILYENDRGLIRVQEVLKKHGPSDPPITVRQLKPGEDNRPLLKEIKSSGESHFILDCVPENIVFYLRQASEVKLFEDYQSYILTSLDAHTVDFGDLKYGRSNVTGFRMLDPQNHELKSAVNDWEQGEIRNGRPALISPDSVKLSAALMSDAVNHFSSALADLDSSQGIQTTSITCQTPQPWPDGFGLVQYMKIKPSLGLTGQTYFETNGRRTQFVLDIIEQSQTGFKKIGTWDWNSGINYTRSESEVTSILSEKWQNKTFIVTSRIGAPFLMMKEAQPGEILTGNDRYEGYSMDLIAAIAKSLNFKFLFELVPDKAYGSYNKETKKWNGLVRELLDGRADLAICDLTITYERRTAVDFTMPFMTLGISILYSKPVVPDPDLFSFLKPFSLDVWIFTATAFLGVSILLYIVARMSPGEWVSPHPCDENNPELENSLTLMNCMWMVMGSILQQGSDILPRAVSTRMIAGMWWFFTLIMISSYTANLAAFLTNERMGDAISSAEDLAKQTKIKYGAVQGGSTAGFFKDSNFSTYKRMWTAMESTKPSVFVKSNDEGVDRVRKGKNLYAFLMESTSIDYITERYCDLMQIGGQLDSKGYGIAMPFNSPYRTAISGAVLKLQEEGTLQSLKTKWWKEMHGGGACKDDAGSGGAASAAELGIDNVGGVFVVLAAGCAMALAITLIEFLWNVKNVAIEEKVSLIQAMKGELKFALDISKTTKPVKTESSEAKSSTKSRSKSNEISEGENNSEKEKNSEKENNSLKEAPSIIKLDKF